MHGRGFWILDDITPLRQIGAEYGGAQDAVLFKPTTAWRVRWNTSTDMPWPVEEPTSSNPPDGAIINYYLKSACGGTSHARDPAQKGSLRSAVFQRRPSDAHSTGGRSASAALLVPFACRALSVEPGMHRFVWDMHYQPLADGGGGGRGGLPIQAIPYNSAPAPTTPWVSPGTYAVKLTVDGQSYTQPIQVNQDPRVKTPALTMTRVYSLTSTTVLRRGGCIRGRSHGGVACVRRPRKIQANANGPLKEALAAFDKRARWIGGHTKRARWWTWWRTRWRSAREQRSRATRSGALASS